MSTAKDAQWMMDRVRHYTLVASRGEDNDSCLVPHETLTHTNRRTPAADDASTHRCVAQHLNDHVLPQRLIRLL